MLISLVRPNYRTHLITPPLGLGYISSYLTSKGIKTKIIDGLNLEISNDEIVKLVKGSDLVGISVLTDYFYESKKLALKLKKAGYPVVIGGPHASALPAETLKETNADYVIVGEGEESIFNLISGNKTAPGIFTSESTFKKREFFSDITKLPFPDWEKINPNKYKKAPHGGLIKNFPVAPIVSSRGCPFGCKFCASPKLWNRKIRYRNPENVVDEMEYLVKNYGIKEIHFEDDNLTLNRNHIENICNLIIKRKINVSWATPNGIRAETLDDELVKLMKESGCYYMVFGIESGNQKILDNIGKQIKLETIQNAVELAHKNKIMTQGFFIFGLPGETKETVSETLKFAKKIPLDRAQFLLLDLLPGSVFWDELSQEKPHSYYKSYQEAAWVPQGMNKNYLEKMRSYAFRSFFFRPRQIVLLIKYFKLSQIEFVIKRILDFKMFGIGRSN